MTQPGWYPDPAGTPNSFRYWDGRGWSAQTTSNPATAPPPPAGPPAKRGRGPLVLVAVLALVVVIIGVFVVRGLLSSDSTTTTTDPGPLPSSTVSGGDDRSPTPTPSSPSPTPTPSETQTEEPPPDDPPDEQSQPCADGDPSSRANHPSDGRIHGGDLSFAALSDSEWPLEGGMSRLSWAYDVAGQAQMTEPGWQAMFAVGALGTVDGFETPKKSAGIVVDCMATSSFYSGFTGRKDLWSKSVTVDGKPGWWIRTEIRVDDPQVDAEGDVLDVIVVDTDQPEALSMFIGGVPIGDKDRIAIMDKVVKDLRVS